MQSYKNKSTMKNLLVLILSFMFCKGFFTASHSNAILIAKFGDKNLHLLVFFLFPLLFFILLKNTYLRILSVLFFGCMTYGVEIIQKHFTHRCYSFTDFKYSLTGFLLFVIVIFVYYLIQTLFHIGLKLCRMDG